MMIICCNNLKQLELRMKKDILNRKDIEKLVNLFYEKVKQDKIITIFF